MLDEKFSAIQEFYTKIKTAQNETVKKELFILLLSTLFGSQNKIVEQFTLGAEKAIVNIKREDKDTDYGRADTQYGSVIIEFENNLAKTGKHAEEQLKDYLCGNWNSGIQARFTLISTDCMNWRIYSPDYEALINLENVESNKINFVLHDEFKLTKDNANDFYFFLDRYIFHTEILPATLENIRREFGLGSETFCAVIKKLSDIFATIKKEQEIQIAFSEWEKFLSIAYGKFTGTEEVFLIHSYLSILAKMIAYKVIFNDKFVDENKLEAILTGDIFKTQNIENFVEEDFYRWVSVYSNKYQVKEVIYNIITELDRFNFNNIQEDILKGIYQELIDDDTKHALGEHYTPDWLCDHIIEHLNLQANKSILDPSCGSGSFLKSAASYLINKNPDISAKELASFLYGIDVHPLSVQIAKATLLIVLNKRLQKETSPIRLNIFLANTLLLPKEDVTLLGKYYIINISDYKITIPVKIFEDHSLFMYLISICERLSIKDQELLDARNKKSINKIFLNIIKTNDESILTCSYNLYRTFWQLKKDDKNGIWSYIVTNFYTPIFLKNKFDYVIGNPPWLTYRDIVSANYQDELNKIADHVNVKPQRVNLFTHLELAAIFLGHALDFFLKPKGQLAFVLPYSFFCSEQHENTRNSRVNYCKLTEVWDLFNVTPLFKVPACVLFAERGEKHESKLNSLPAKIFNAKFNKHNIAKSEADKNIKIIDDLVYLSNLNSTSAWNIGSKINITGLTPYFEQFKQGATLVPRNLCFVDIEQEFEGSIKNRFLKVRSCQDVLRDAKKPWKDQTISGRINTKFLFRTLLSKNIVPFSNIGSYLVVLPCLVEDKQIKMITAQNIESLGDLDTSEWFEQYEKIWNKFKTEKSKNMTYLDRINFQNGLTSQNLNRKYCVLYISSGTNAVATIIQRNENDLFFIVDSKCYVYFTNNKLEAYYLLSILNANYINSILKPFQTKGLFGERDIHKKILNIPFPQFDANNKDHNDLAILTLNTTKKVNTYLKTKDFDEHGNNLSALELGRLRTEIRKYIKDELKEIDNILVKIFN